MGDTTFVQYLIGQSLGMGIAALIGLSLAILLDYVFKFNGP